MERLDQAVERVLRVKYRAGLLDTFVQPSGRPNAGRYDLLGSAEHRAIAREAVAKSQVLLKNNGVLPLKAGANVLVAGSAADDIAQASGGWTLTWQGGGDLDNSYFPGATSIWKGLETAVKESGGQASLSADGSYSTKPDVAVVVFGEEPYAEFAGDRKHLGFTDVEGLNLLAKFKAEGVPTVAVFLSGRPMWVNREMNAADAFVASWLPGSEGAGIADVLTGKVPATGKLGFSWPATCDFGPLNGPDGALFKVGYGRSLGDTSATPQLNEECAPLTAGAAADWYVNGRLADGVLANTATGKLDNLRGSAGGVTAIGLDRNAQEDARTVTFAPGGSFELAQAGGTTGVGYRIAYEVPERPQQKVTLKVGDETIDVTQALSVAAGKGWREMIVTDECGGDLDPSLAFASDGAFAINIGSVVREEFAPGTSCSF